MSESTATVTVGEELPEKIGPYLIQDRLGAGGMGAVYRAYDQRLDRRVALKRILPEKAEKPKARERFLREARAAARLNHPAIVQIHDIVEDEGCDWIVMELVEGTPLAVLVRSAPLELDQGLPLAIEIATGLAAAHAAGIVHRDLKAENVVITREGRAKILDFGLAKPLERQEGETSVSASGVLLGTPRAMSPEQVRNLEVDHRSDLFSLGTLLYEMFTATNPFLEASWYETLRKIHREPHTPARVENPRIPHGLSNLIDRLLEKDPADRPQSAGEVALALRRLTATPGSMGVADGLQIADGEAGGEAETTADRPPPIPAAEESHQTEERRQITVLCCNLVAAGGAPSPLDAETLAEVMPEFRAVAEATIERFDGHLANVLGHRLVLYFGYPRAHEDDARRAVLTAMRLRERVAELSGELPGAPRLALRLGIHTGPVVVMAAPAGSAFSQPGPSGSGLASELVLGETLDLATGIESHAPPDAVVVSAATRPLIESFFTFEELAPATLTGFDRPLELHRVLGARDARSQASMDAAPGPLIARTQELELLLDRWRLARAGAGQVVLVSGEAGIGKSRLIQSLEKQLAPPTWLVAQGSPYAQSSPLHPIIELLRRFLELGGDEPEERQITRLEEALDRHGLPPAEAVPLFAQLLSLPLDARHPPLDLGPEKRRRMTLEALVALVLGIAERQPAALVIEDLHWADPSTLEFLGLLIDQAAAAPLFLLLSFRAGFEEPWRQRADVTRLNLRRLTTEEAESLIDRLPGGEDIPTALRRLIVEKTDGVPLFVEELTKTVLESGLADRDWSSRSFRLSVPATLRDSLTARLDRLGRAKSVAQLAAALGREFPHALLNAVSTLEPAVLERELERLVAAGLLYRKGFASRATYVFKHALIQEAAYESLLKGSRRKHHRRIAETVVERFPELAEGRPEILAHHFTEALVADQAVDCWLRAAAQAVESCANLEAIAHLEKGLELLESLPTAERHRRELALRMAMGAPLAAALGYVTPRLEQNLKRAQELCELLDEPAGLFQTVAGLGAVYLVRAELDKTMDQVHRLIPLVDAGNDPFLSAYSHYAWGITQLFRGHPREARDHLAQALELDPPERDQPLPSMTGEDLGVAVRCIMALAEWLLGHPDQALERGLGAIALARRIRDPRSIVFALTHTGFVHHFRGDRQAVRDQVGEGLALAHEKGFYDLQPLAEFLLGSAGQAGSAGDPEAGGEDPSWDRMRQALAAWRAPGAAIWQTFFLATLAETGLARGRAEEADPLIDEALAAAERTGERFWQAELHRLRGEALRAAANGASSSGQRDAEQCFEQAAALARQQQAAALELRALISLSRPGRSRGPAAARDRLAGLRERFTEGLDTADLRAAGALLG